MDQGLINTFLHTFISPVTGRFLMPDGYIPIGNSDGIAVPSAKLIHLEIDLIGLREDHNMLGSASFVTGFPNEEAPQAQVLSLMNDGFLYNTEGIVSTRTTISAEDLTLPQNKVFLGDENNKAVPAATILLQNLPNLTFQRVWRGDVNNRPVESNALTDAEGSITDILSQIASILSTISSLQSLVNSLQSAVDGIGGAVGLLFLQTQVLGLIADLAVLKAKVNGLTVTLEGDVIGSGSIYDPIPTILTLTLDKIKLAVDTVNLNNQKIINLKSDQVEQFDAINAKFLWDLMHDEVSVIWL